MSHFLMCFLIFLSEVNKGQNAATEPHTETSEDWSQRGLIGRWVWWLMGGLSYNSAKDVFDCLITRRATVSNSKVRYVVKFASFSFKNNMCLEPVNKLLCVLKLHTGGEKKSLCDVPKVTDAL